MSTEDNINRIIKLIMPMVRGNHTVEPGTMIIEDGVIDSLSVINLIMEIEREFGMRIKPMDVTIDDFQSPERIEAAIGRLQAK